MTQEGLLGLIPTTRFKQQDKKLIRWLCGFVGKKVMVSIDQLRPDRFAKILQRAKTAKFLNQNKKDIVNPQMVRDFHGDYPIFFSYSRWLPYRPAIMELASKYKVGDVVDAKIVRIDQTSMIIEVEGVPFLVRKVDISATRQNFNLTDLFSTEEMIKVYYCLFSDPEDMRWSIRALEPSPGAILFDKDKVFEEAEETAKIFYELQKLQMLQQQKIDQMTKC